MRGYGGSTTFVNPRAFEVAVTQLGEQAVRQFTRLVVLGAALEVAKVLTTVTPVRSGRAMGNWEISADGEQPDGSYDWDRFDDGSATFERLRSRIMEIGDPLETIWFWNGIYYVAFLDAGTVKMQAVDMSGQAFEAARRYVERVVGQLA